jgi:hypothetical protein
MSQQTFDANEPAIRAGVTAIMRNPKWRKRSRLFVLYESSGGLLAEVFDTKHGPVIAHHSWGSIERLRTVVVGAPRGRGQGQLVVAPLTDDPRQYFSIMARTFRRRVAVSNFRAWMAKGETEHTIST